MIGVLLVAAGQSARLGTPKQLLPWAGKTLLHHAARTALEAELGPVGVVLGSSEPACRAALESLPLETISHPKWSEGMGGSIAAGVRAFQKKSLEAIVVMLCDQPFVRAETLCSLATDWRRGGCDIVATRTPAGILGPPALFSAGLFPRLMELRGHEGARALFRDESRLRWIERPEAAADIDTPDDWAAIREHESIKGRSRPRKQSPPGRST